MSAQFPNVPALPGVPQLARQITSAVSAAQATVSGINQAIAIQLGLPSSTMFGTNPSSFGQTLSPGSLPSYGFFQSVAATAYAESAPGFDADPPPDTVGNFNQKSVLQPDSVMEFAINADSTINSHPIEEGGFEAFNRVQEPISIRMLLACQGKNMTRQTFVSTLQGLREGTQVITIATPDAMYPNMVLKGFGYKKTSDRGFVTIWADTQWLEERSKNVTVSSPPTATPQGAATTNLGTLQPATPSTQAQSVISNPPVPPVSLPSEYASTEPTSGDAY